MAVAHNSNLSRKIPFALSFLALLSGIGTFWVLFSESSNLEAKTRTILPFIYLDLILLLLLAIFIAKRLVELWLERKRGLVGSKLHVHIVALFSTVVIVPVICGAGFSALFFNVGVETWFGQPVKDTLEEARIVAEAYLREHKKAVVIDALNLANKLRPQVSLYIDNPEAFSQILNDAADEHGLEEVLIFNGTKEVVARSYLTFALEFEKISYSDFDTARSGDTVTTESGDRVRALIRLDPTTDTYLFVGKFIDPTVLQHLTNTQNALQDYLRLAGQHSGLQITFVAFFFLVALLLLLAAIWIGLTFATILIKPISRLMAAAESVSQGDLSVKIEEEPMNYELDKLVHSFNQMTHQLQQQKHDLIISQRKAAWSDVARKIAHEIKNPLTPIQLSAERLKRRYLREIKSDPRTFQSCIDTIIRQVENIGNLVNEFSSFARMPEPKIEKVDLTELIRHTLILQQQAHSSIRITYRKPEAPVTWFCDKQQISQALTNLLQNAINAVSESHPAAQLIKKLATIILSLEIKDEKVVITVEDNGPGFPQEGRERLTEPYYTTREKGTGLGLAIVSKIVSDHNGHMHLGDSILGGACVQLTFPFSQ
ncbi:MAG: ATP-binding protein [Alphaproteobacteria bacterium]|nr:ATP-binding protein [Alphaproteobacteria bacterium]